MQLERYTLENDTKGDYAVGWFNLAPLKKMDDWLTRRTCNLRLKITVVDMRRWYPCFMKANLKGFKFQSWMRINDQPHDDKIVGYSKSPARGSINFASRTTPTAMTATTHLSCSIRWTEEVLGYVCRFLLYKSYRTPEYTKRCENLYIICWSARASGPSCTKRCNVKEVKHGT